MRKMNKSNVLDKAKEKRLKHFEESNRFKLAGFIFSTLIEERRCNNMCTMNKIRIIIATIIGIFIIIIVVLVVKVRNTVIDSNIQNNIVQDVNDINKLNMDDNYVDIIRTIAEKNSDWSNLPLSKKFRKKYKSKYGILGKGDNYTDLYGSYRLSDKEKSIATLVIFHNYKKEEYYIHYILNDQNELDDVEIVDKKLLYDEEGNEVIYKRDMNEAWIGNIIDLAIPWRFNWDRCNLIYTTEKYNNKWRNGFIPTYDCEHFDIKEVKDLCNKDKKEVYLDINYEYYNEEDGLILSTIKIDKRYYKVHYTTDDNLWLDDVEVEEVSKEEIDVLLNKAKDKATNSEIN